MRYGRCDTTLCDVMCCEVDVGRRRRRRLYPAGWGAGHTGVEHTTDWRYTRYWGLQGVPAALSHEHE
jgi:hypothetical protein